MKPSTDRRRTAYYRADVQGLNPGDAATRTLDPLDGKEYTYATTRLDVARAIAARHADFSRLPRHPRRAHRGRPRRCRGQPW